jgi:Family of unknown function (DUF6510)
MSGAPLDGNAAAGVLSEFFLPEMTTASSTCASCGAVSPLGGLPTYMQAPGAVLRCTACDAVQMRVVSSPERAWLDMQGIRALELKRPSAV